MNKQKLRKKSTTVSKSDKVNVEEVFSMLDFDQDGFLSGNDIVQAVWAAGVPSSPEEIAKAVASLKDSAEGKVDAKAFKLLCKELKPKDSSMASFYDNQFKILGIDQDGLVDLGQFKKILTTTGYKMSDSNIDSFFRHIRKEESGKVKLSAILDKLSSVNVII